MDEPVDTGFGDVLAGAAVWKPPEETSPAIQITATVNPPPQPAAVEAPTQNPGLTAEGIQAAKSLVRLPNMTYTDLARMARDVAMDIKELHVILSDYKLDQAQYDFLEAHNEFYKSALGAACKEWHAPLSTAERIKVEAAAILEDSLIGLGARMRNSSEGLPGVVEVGKLFAKIAGVGEREAGSAAPGERFTINIDLGGDQKITVASSPPPAVPQNPNSVRTLSADG
jgi:hypothetical protein